MRQAQVISTGNEVILGEIIDTNAQYLSRRLTELGIAVVKRVTVGDDLDSITAALKEAAVNADVVLVTGGLGPTDDDLTAQALALSLGRDLVFCPEAWEMISARLAKRGRVPLESDRKQAFIVRGGTFLPNNEGTAPGQAVAFDGKLIVILPGPPREMRPMFEDHVVPLIREQFPDRVSRATVNLKVVGIPEASLGEIISDLMAVDNPRVAPYVGLGEIRVRISATAHTEAEAKQLVARMESEVHKRLGRFIYGRDEDTLEAAVGKLMAARGLTLAVAESVSGGLLSHRLTTVPGSSRYLKLSMVAYAPEIKVSCLSVPREQAFVGGAVSAEVARAMAEGVRRLAGADIGLSTTGFAGPEGGTESEPVGTVYVGLSYADGTSTYREVFAGSRTTVIERAAGHALYVLWRFLTASEAAKAC